MVSVVWCDRESRGGTHEGKGGVDEALGPLDELWLDGARGERVLRGRTSQLEALSLQSDEKGRTGKGPGARNVLAVREMAWYTSGRRVDAGPGRVNSPRAHVCITRIVSSRERVKESEEQGRTCSRSSSSSLAAATLGLLPCRTSSTTLVSGLRRKAIWTPNWRVRFEMVGDSATARGSVTVCGREEERAHWATGGGTGCGRREGKLRARCEGQYRLVDVRERDGAHLRTAGARSWPTGSSRGRPCGTRGRGSCG